MSAWGEQRLKLIAERGSKCEVCGRLVPAHTLQQHHAFYRRRKGFTPFDKPENIALVEETCHMNGDLGWEFKQRFWDVQCSRYDMNAYIESLPCKIKAF